MTWIMNKDRSTNQTTKKEISAALVTDVALLTLGYIRGRD
jgi:hypothetical protein